MAIITKKGEFMFYCEKNNINWQNSYETCIILIVLVIIVGLKTASQAYCNWKVWFVVLTEDFK